MHRPRSVIAFIAVLLGIGIALPARAQLATLAADLTPGADDGASFPSSFTFVNGRLVFLAEGSTSGSYEPDLWVTDGTIESTEILIAGPPHIDFGNPILIGRGPDRLFWRMGLSSLWSTDGTPEGTWILNPYGYGVGRPGGDTASGELYPFVSGRLFFPMTDPGPYGEQTASLWTSDGTPAETHPVAIDLPGAEILGIGTFQAVGNRVLFHAAYRIGAVTRTGLFRTDGTPGGTTLVREWPDYPDWCADWRWTVDLGNQVLFFGGHCSDEELWATDGTAAGTIPLTRFAKPHPFRGEDAWLQRLAGHAYFVADGGEGLELWSTDGTAAGTRRATDLAAPSPFSGWSTRNQVTALGNLVYFVAREPDGKFYLWSTNGSPASTRKVVAIEGGSTFVGEENFRIARVGNRVFFPSRPGGNSELWSTDGTAAGSSPVAVPRCSSELVWSPGVPGDENAAFAVGCPPGLGPELFRIVPNTLSVTRWTDLRVPTQGPIVPLAYHRSALLFSVAVTPHFRELWVTEGPPASTRRFLDRIWAHSSSPVELTALGDDLYFRLDGEGQDRLWRSRGDEASTVAVAGPGDGCPLQQPRLNDPGSPLAAAGGYLFFACEDSEQRQLWRTDGTPSGTIPLLSFEAAPLAEIVAAGARVYAVARGHDRTAVGTIWVSDGTPAGTSQLLTTAFGAPRPVFGRSLAAVGDRIVFRDGHSHWISDGTAAGTLPLTSPDNENAFHGDAPIELAVFGGARYFLAYASAQDVELWRTDATVPGTQRALRLADLGVATALDLRSLGDELVFLGWPVDSTHPSDRLPYLYRTDGTPAGTVRVSETPVWYDWHDFLYSDTTRSAVLDGEIYFAGEDSEHGVELWKSDGSEAGTLRVRDVAPDAAPSHPRWFFAAEGRVFFSAWTPHLGVELWVTDGTPDGTRLIHDIAPGPRSSEVGRFAVAGSRLFFVADDAHHGHELWSLPLDDAGCLPSDRALCLNAGRFRVEADWEDFQGGRGRGTAVPLTADTGYFWFFRNSNVEAVLKVLDGRPLNGHFWVFYGALSNVPYALTVTDAESGVSRRYLNPAGRFASRGDTEAFGPRGSSLESSSAPLLEPATALSISRLRRAVANSAAGSCEPSATRLCLQGERFAVEATWRDFQGNTGVGTAVRLTPDTGYFWFFRETNVEVVLKVLDGRPLNGHFWVFYGALSNVEYTLTVTDTETGTEVSYPNPSGRFGSVGDTLAF